MAGRCGMGEGQRGGRGAIERGSGKRGGGQEDKSKGAGEWALTIDFLKWRAAGRTAMSLALPCSPPGLLGVFELISWRTFFLLGVMIASILSSRRMVRLETSPCCLLLLECGDLGSAQNQISGSTNAKFFV